MSRRRCVRCGVPQDEHDVIGATFRSCPGYVEPAPWWLRLLTRLLP